MALVRSFQRKFMERNSAHQEVAATYSSFEQNGQPYLQIDTYGRDDRQLPGKISQTIQLDREGAVSLVEILRREFRLA